MLITLDSNKAEQETLFFWIGKTMLQKPQLEKWGEFTAWDRIH